MSMDDTEFEKKLSMAAYQKMLELSDNTKIELEAILAKMQKVGYDIHEHRLSLEINTRQAIDRVGTELTIVAKKMQEGFDAQNKMPAKKRLQWSVTMVFSCLMAGLIGGFAVYYLTSIRSAEVQHQLTAGLILKEAFPKLSEKDQAIITAIVMGTPDPTQPPQAKGRPAVPKNKGKQ